MDKPGAFVMLFGKYKGKRLNQIATTDRGLLYLDWLVGEFDPGPVKAAVEAYISDAGIQQQIAALVAGK